MEETNIQIGGGRRLVLGFDAGCTTCSDLAKKIEEAVGDKLEIRSLYDPQVRHWREQVLGENASWAPTLIEVRGAGVRAWTGVRMGVALSTRIGPAATWRVMQILGDPQDRPRLGESSSAATIDISRKRFLRGIGGTAVALGILTGTGNLASAATSKPSVQDDAPEALRSLSKTDLSGEELTRAARRVAQRSDIVNLMGKSWSDRVRDGRASRSLEDDGQTIQLRSETVSHADPRSASSSVTVKAAKHKLRSGVTMLAVGYKLSQENKVLLYYEFDRPVPDGVDESRSQATLYRAEGDEALLERVSVDGKNEVSLGSKELSARGGCGVCGPGDCLRTIRVCKSIKWGCLAVACAGCIPACSSILGCLYCAGVQCPYAYNYGCCRRRGTRCAGCNSC